MSYLPKPFFLLNKRVFCKKIRNFQKKPQLFGLYDVYIYTGIGFQKCYPTEGIEI